MDIRRLEIFLKLLETGSFSRTAAALNLAQPSVSASLKALEDSLGQKLFERTPRSVKALPTAEILQPYALNIVETMGRAAWAVGRQLSDPREKLTLGASSVPAIALLPGALTAFNREYPNILIKIKTGSSRAVSRKLADGELDLAVVGAAPEDEELERRVVGHDRLVLLVSRQLARNRGDSPPGEVEELLDWPLIMREEGSGTRAAFMAALGQSAGGLLGSRINIKAEVDGLGPSLALVRHSFGAAVISDLLLPVINLRGLAALNLAFLNGRNFYLINRRGRQVSPALQAFISHLSRAPQKSRDRA
ncbi:MAG: LysR family transcriptional regulator [Candidatus Adiutrix sp.]|jgi:DNA-binding transcriptional LysR family regulator|nr:LysR family transcriptional regulator [Candidatus Adiutrix sp.]